MMSTSGWLYDGDGQPIGDAPEFALHPEWQFRSAVIAAAEWDEQPVDRVWFLPAGNPLPIPPWVVMEMVGALDSGCAVALLATSAAALAAAAGVLDALGGGVRA